MRSQTIDGADAAPYRAEKFRDPSSGRMARQSFPSLPREVLPGQIPDRKRRQPPRRDSLAFFSFQNRKKVLKAARFQLIKTV
jgi:hypothetical protein